MTNSRYQAQSGTTLAEGMDLSAQTGLPAMGSDGADGVAAKLGLSSSDVDAYVKLWDAADTSNGLLPAGTAVKFLGTSGLPQETLRSIWGMSDTDAPRGQLDKDEFFKVGCYC